MNPSAITPYALPINPADFPRRVLLAVSGLTPQIVTETLYALAADEFAPFVPTEVHLITSAEGDFAVRLKEQLVIVSDDMFSHLAQYTTAITPHIAIDNTRKTVKNGALWYEETLSPETVLYVALAADASRKSPKEKTAQHMLETALALFPQDHPYLQLGGNETVGMGWCRVTKVGA